MVIFFDPRGLERKLNNSHRMLDQLEHQMCFQIPAFFAVAYVVFGAILNSLWTYLTITSTATNGN